jgi:hypothetical protein
VAPTIQDLLAVKTRARAAAETRYQALQDRMFAVVDQAKREGRQNLTAAEDALFETLRAQRSVAKANAAAADDEYRRAERTAAEEAETDRRLRRTHRDPEVARIMAHGSSTAPVTDVLPVDHTAPNSVGAVRSRARQARTAGGYDRQYRVGAEARVYSPETDPTGSAFLHDVAGAYRGSDPSAVSRLGRYMDEERVERGQYLTRAAGTGNFAGLTVPQYLTDMYAPAVAAMRPFADACAHHDLPRDGMTVNLSRVTTATSVALQATEGNAVANQDPDDTLLTENVQTAAGYATLSRQAIDRGTNVEDVTMGDLQKRYASTLDSTLINQTTTGLAALAVSQAYVNATVDTTAIPAVWKAIIQAQNTSEGVLLAQAPVTHVIIHNRRWNWLTAAVSASWPVIAGTNQPVQSWGVRQTNEYGAGIRGVCANGLKVITDFNISTVCLGTALTGGTQDQIYVVAADECHLWEDPNAPQFIRAEQPQATNLAVQLVLYGYFAYTLRRYPGAFVVINGTGLATPSFA